MGKRRFSLSFHVDLEVELDDEVISRVDDEWRNHLYPLTTDEEIVRHVAYNLAQGTSLDGMDGWADMDRSQARLLDEYWDDAEFREITEGA